MSSINDSDKTANIFNLFTKYRFVTYNSIISSDSQIYKFKERIQNFNKIFGEMESKKYNQKEIDQFQIIVKEGKDKKIFTESIQDIDEETKEEILSKTENEIPKEKKEETKSKKKSERKNLCSIGRIY